MFGACVKEQNNIQKVTQKVTQCFGQLFQKHYKKIKITNKNKFNKNMSLGSHEKSSPWCGL